MYFTKDFFETTLDICIAIYQLYLRIIRFIPKNI